MSKYLTNRNKGLFSIVFAIFYFIFTVWIIGHGAHLLNSMVTIGLVGVGIYFLKLEG